ncbi:P-loop containing nucleoside triphosphate hydrolase protein, partial [Mycena vulgaris]
FFRQDLEKQHIFLLHGLGGAGKTQIALKFIEEFSSHFSDIFLIDTSTTETIDTAFGAIATTQNAGNTTDDALKWLRSKPAEWLLFFDNADDPRINLNKFFPQCDHGNILITSRNPGLRVYAGSHSLVSDMEELDAVALLLKSCAEEITPRNKELATEIVKALYYLPLAIIQAGAFIAKSGALSSYLNLYSENQARLLSQQPDQSHDDYARTVYTTWQISFERLSKPAATLLQLFSFLHHKGISEDIFSRASVYQFTPHSPSKEELHDLLEFLSLFVGPTGVWNSLYFMEIMNEIRAYSLANFDLEKALYSIHPLVHSWSRGTVTNQQYYDWMVAVVGMSISAISDQDIQLASVPLLPHVDSLIHEKTSLTVDLGLNYARIYYYVGRLRNSEELELGALNRLRNVLGKEHPDTLTGMENLGLTYHTQGKWAEAEELQLAVLKNRRKILGEEHMDTVMAMSRLASTYNRQGKFNKAMELQVAVLKKRKRVLREDHPATLRAMAYLASAYENLKQFKEAEELEIVVFEKRRKILGEDHPDTLLAMGNLALTYHEMGKFKEAEKLEVVLLEKQKKILGEDYEDTIKIMAALGITYYKLGKFREAEELEVVVLRKQRKILGEDHPDTLNAMSNLGSTYHKMGRFEDAAKLECVLLEKRRKILGDEHSDTLYTLGNLAATYYQQEKWMEAEPLYVELLNRKTALLGADHRDSLRAAGSLAQTRLKQ